MFFLVFHLFLNITGELLMFGDRVFYKVCSTMLLILLLPIRAMTHQQHVCPT